MSDNPKHIILGLGEVVVSSGRYKGYPCLAFWPAKHPAEPRAKTVAEEDLERTPEEAVILMFATPDAVAHHVDRLKDLVTAIHDEQIAEMRNV